ncbi:MAG TPA: winged helix DNA-binding domain-containing protein [Actinomycetota bacterium]|nr:winged helix DNA-binding domain-containing protein [Actinomycetota bacterium]
MHGLERDAGAGDALELASRLCGLHAQLMSSAELTLWARVADLEQGWLDRALWDDRTLVKTWAMRGTLHLLPTAEMPLWHAALATYSHFEKDAWLRAFGVTSAQLDALLEAVSDVVAAGAVTRAELADAVARRTRSKSLGDKVLESWGAVLKPAAFRGALVFAPNAGRNVRFVHPRTWLGDARSAPPDDPLVEVARRYLAAYGPATREDLARWWAGVTPARAGALIAALGDDVAEVDVDGTRAWMLAADVRLAAGAPPRRDVRLLPAFDQFVVAAPRATPPLAPPGLEGRVFRPQGWISAVVLVGGAVAGVWRHERKGRRVVVRIEPFSTVSRAVRHAAEDEAERLAAFVGGVLELAWGRV